MTSNCLKVNEYEDIDEKGSKYQSLHAVTKGRSQMMF